jgi:hypothetical protein
MLDRKKVTGFTVFSGGALEPFPRPVRLFGRTKPPTRALALGYHLDSSNDRAAIARTQAVPLPLGQENSAAGA